MIRILATFVLAVNAGLPLAQPVNPKVAKVDAETLLKADKPANVIKLLGLNIDPGKIPTSNSLLLEVAPIVPPGPIPVRLMSEMPNTDLLLLFDPQPRDKEPSLLVAHIVEPGTAAEVKTKIELSHNAELMLVARADGKLYAVKAPVLLAEKEGKAERTAKPGTAKRATKP